MVLGFFILKGYNKTYYLCSFGTNIEKQKRPIKCYGVASVWFSVPASESKLLGQTSDNLSAVYIF